MSKSIKDIVSSWAKDPSSSIELNREEYNIVAKEYDMYLIKELGYTAWRKWVRHVRGHFARDMSVLDVCCGTGLVGTTLLQNGFTNIHGVDLSQRMLDIAKSKNIYKTLTRHDMNKPFLSNGTFDLVTCIGSLTYFDSKGILENIFSLTNPKGVIVLSHRSDMYESQGYERYLNNHSKVKVIKVTKDFPYLPGDPDYGDDIKVKFIILKKL